MAVDISFRKEVDYVARLARLYLNESEKEQMAEEISRILSTARRVQEADTAAVEPTAHLLCLPVTFREDAVTGSLPLNRALQNAPDREKSYFRVPRIAGEESDV